MAAGDNYEAGSVGGESTHKLTTGEMPSHTHTFTGSSATTSSAGAHTHYTVGNNVASGSLTTSNYIATYATNSQSDLPYSLRGNSTTPAIGKTNSAGSHTHTLTAKGSNSNIGGGQAHNNMPPYETYYCWKRTA